MSKADDSVFIRRFSGVILALVGVTVAIIVLAMSLRGEPDPNANPSQKRLADERIAPVAAVRTDANEIPPAEPAPAAPTAPPASDAGIDGSAVYASVCQACHAAGVAGAPQPGSDLLAERLAAKGEEGLVASVINGLNVMPPRGGRPDLSDAQIRAAVAFMLQ